MITQLRYTIPLTPVTKKNHQQIIINTKTKRPMVLPSKQYRAYEMDCGPYLRPPLKPIDYPVNIKAVYYMPTNRRVDLCNLHEALCDILVKYGVIADDNFKIVHSMDGSRVYKDKENPRTEILITKVEDGN